MKQVKIYTDGSCRDNGMETAVGGWSALLQFGGHDKLIKGYESHTTNNKMELRAVIEGVKALHEPCEIEVLTDSNYVVNGAADVRRFIRRNWRNRAGREIVNKELWQELIEVGNKGKHHITFTKVQGHSSNPYNRITDIMAKAMVEEYAK
jgi:ribonuclease HI